MKGFLPRTHGECLPSLGLYSAGRRFLCGFSLSFIRRNQPLSIFDQVRPCGETFNCINCNELVTETVSGTEQRNHCPKCLWSRHVDHQVGDRRSVCRCGMEPIAVWAKPKGEWSLVHRCVKCGALRANRIAGDDNEIILLSIALRPIAAPAFPLHKVGKQ
jgi:hypothetical protein